MLRKILYEEKVFRISAWTHTYKNARPSMTLALVYNRRRCLVIKTSLHEKEIQESAELTFQLWNFALWVRIHKCLGLKACCYLRDHVVVGARA